MLDKREWEDIDLVLQQFNFPYGRAYSNEDTKRGYAMACIREADDGDLAALHTYLQSEGDHSGPGDTLFKGNGVRVFLSHLSRHRQLVGDVSTWLNSYGIESFVAHDTIEPSKEWQAVIEAGLAECDAMIVFLHAGFKESTWCDQEVGWALGRHIPLLPLNFDQNPHGFMGKFQALPCTRTGQTLHPTVIASQIADWLVRDGRLQPRMAETLTRAFRNSASYNQTRELAARLDMVSGYTDAQLDLVQEAVEKNDQVRDANISYTPGPTWVASFIAKHRPAPDDPWATTATGEPPF